MQPEYLTLTNIGFPTTYVPVSTSNPSREIAKSTPTPTNLVANHPALEVTTAQTNAARAQSRKARERKTALQRRARHTAREADPRHTAKRKHPELVALDSS